ncbi:DUF1573 domain-containing protein [bacterium]|nr:DUF1573 domain-containing protein [candidate division CSSED10-310 bacterium]
MASAKDIPPGGEGKIHVTFRTKGKRGVNSKKINVYTNDPQNSQIELEVKAQLEVHFGAKPTRLYFGRIERKQPTTKTLSFEGKELDTIKIEKIEFKDQKFGNSISYDISDNRANPKDTEPLLSMTITLDAKELQPGRFNENMFIYTNSSTTPKLDVGLAGEILGPLTATPPRLYFGSYVPDTEVTRTVNIESADGKPFKLLSATLEDPLLQVADYDKNASVTHSLDIILPKNYTNPRISTNLIIITDLPEQKKLEIPVTGYKKRYRDSKSRKYDPKDRPSIPFEEGKRGTSVKVK